MANEYYERLSEMNPGDLADGLAMEAEFDAISQGFSKLPTPHTGGQGFDGPVRVGDAVNDDEAVNLGQLQAAIGEAVLLDIAIYGNLNATAWGALPSNTYLLFGTGSQLSNTPYTLVAGSTYYLQVRHVIGGAGVSIYHDQISLASTDDASNIDLRRLFVRTGSTFANANAGGWAGFSLKKAALTALESLTPAADRIAYYTSGSAAAMTAITELARTLLSCASASSARSVIDAYGKNNIVGVVAQSGGVPTAAIVERGVNANGEYAKFADGTLICVASRPLGYNGSAAFLQDTWTLPVPHATGIGVAMIMAQISDNGTRKYNRAVPSGGLVGSTSVAMRLWATGTDAFASGDTTTPLPFLFIGRWY
ncbi:hypothetical protein ACV1EH_00735 [Aeromonas caviae]